MDGPHIHNRHSGCRAICTHGFTHHTLSGASPGAEAVCMFVVVPTPTSAKSPRSTFDEGMESTLGPHLFFSTELTPSRRSTRTHPGSSLPLHQVLCKTDLSLRVDTKAFQLVTCSVYSVWVSRFKTRKGYRDLPDFAGSPAQVP